MDNTSSTLPLDLDALLALRRRWLLFLVGCVSFAACGYTLLSQSWEPSSARRWLLLTSLVLVYLLIDFRRGLSYNHRPGESELLPDLGIGNVLSLIRGVMLAGMTGFLFSIPPPGWLGWVPGLLYFLAILGDFLDGSLARKTNHVTRLGEMLDIDFDGLGVLASVSLVVWYGQVPAWFLLVALARYLFLFGLWIRNRRNLPVYDLPFSIRRRLLAGLTMGILAFLLLPIFTTPGTTWVAAAFAIPFLGGFIWDWLAASGVIQPEWSWEGWDWKLAGWAGFLLRWLAVVILLLPRINGTRSWENWIGMGLALMLALGLLGRFTAGIGLLLLGLLQIYVPLSPMGIILIPVFCWILMLGTGYFSLWAPENRLIQHRIGENRHDSD